MVIEKKKKEISNDNDSDCEKKLSDYDNDDGSNGTFARSRDSQFWEFGKPDNRNAFLEHQHDYASYPSIENNDKRNARFIDHHPLCLEDDLSARHLISIFNPSFYTVNRISVLTLCPN